jgi:arylsulfatase A-like enzyme
MIHRTRRPIARASVVLVAVVLGLAVAVPSETEAQSEPTPQPNVIIFMTDDQRADTMRVMPKTRRWFRKRGVKYPNGFTTTPLCCPARASVFTGQYAHNHGVMDNGDALELEQPDTLQRHLDDAGYFTALSGKYLNKWDIERRPPHFDRFAMLRQGNDAYYDSTFNVDGRVRLVRRYSTHFIERKATDYLESFDDQNDDAPWFLVVTPFAPHNPALPSARYADASVPRWEPTPADLEKDRSDKPPIVRESHRSLKLARQIRRQQLRSLMSVDDMVNSIMRSVRQLEESTQTLSFFLSDNGFTWAEHRWGQGKRVPYLPVIRIPLFARWPGHLSAATLDRRFATNVDIAPTVFDAANIEPGHVLDGRSLLDPWERNRLLIEFFEDARVPPWASTWTPGRQYVEWYGDDATTVTFLEYYNLVKDPWQLRNRLGDSQEGNDPSPATLARLSAQLSSDRRCAGTTGPSACP